MEQQMRGRVKRAVKRVAPQPLLEIRTRLNRQHHRLTELEAEVQELRRLHVRVAELTDIVEELLVPLAQQDKEKLSSLLAEYNEKL